MYVRNKRRIQSISDRNGFRIAVLKESIQEAVLQQMTTGFGLQVSFVETESFSEAFSLTARGEADAVVINNLFGSAYYRQFGLKPTPIVLNPVLLYFAVRDGSNADLLRAIDSHLREMKSQPGSVYYQALQEVMKRTPGPVLPRYVFWLLGGISGSLLLAVLFVFLLHRQVRAATRELTRANEMLRESEKKFRDLFRKHSAVKLILCSDDGTIVEANEAAETFYGWSGEELLRMRIRDIDTMPAEQIEEELEKIRQGKQSCFSSRHRLADGSVRDVEVYGSEIDIQGRTHLHFIVHDITEKRRLEEQYRQAQKMEFVGRLAGGIAHDYNNTLCVILGYTELALSKIPPGDPLHAHLVGVLHAARRSADITRQLLAFARRQPMEPKVLDMNRSVASMLSMLCRLIGENIELLWRPGTDAATVYMDPSQLDQILVNLCTNARDAIDGVGKIVVETRQESLDKVSSSDPDGAVSGEFVVLTVRDDGRGMDRETLNQIFEPFFTTREAGKGTGLGLATVYGIVRQNNGLIRVRSELGKGSEFRIYLPRHLGTVEDLAEDHDREIPRGDGETVLLVEDDTEILELGEEMLHALGYRVLAANTPRQALQIVREHAGEIALLITDVVMPEMNGRQMADQILALRPRLKVLFMSGYAAEILAPRGAREEETHFLQKPFSLKTLAFKIQTALGKENSPS